MNSFQISSNIDSKYFTIKQTYQFHLIIPKFI